MLSVRTNQEWDRDLKAESVIDDMLNTFGRTIGLTKGRYKALRYLGPIHVE
jgi:hypothetical protein